MSYVAIIGGVATVGAAYVNSSNKAGSGGGGGAGGMGFSTASAASYGTTIGNDGWSVNIGDGTQTANPTESNSASYPTEQNPLTALQPRQYVPDGVQTSVAGMDPQMLLLLGLGGLVLVKAMRK